jgi:predicted nucleic acid-binding protein
VIIVVSDTSPIRALSHLDLLTVLEELFSQVIVPPTVARELLEAPSRLPRVNVLELGFVQVRAPSVLEKVEELLQTLDPGEADALALALEIGALAVLIDESAGRAMANQLGVPPIGVLGILVRAKQRGLVSSVGGLVDRLQKEIGFIISATLRAEILRIAGAS